LDKALSLIPGRHRIGLMTIYAEPTVKKNDWDEIEPEDYARWLDWGKGRIKCFDFLPTLFSHPKVDNDFMLAHRDEGIRKFWVDVSKAGRRITEHFGREFGCPAVCNHWAPDGSKDTPADRRAPRERLKQSFDEIFSEKLDHSCIRDAMEGKLFGLSSESYVVGSHEF
jgi:L-rhamnose isomerase